MLVYTVTSEIIEKMQTAVALTFQSRLVKALANVLPSATENLTFSQV